MSGSQLPLDTLAKTIVAALNKSEDYMVTAGRHLIEAQDRVQAGEAGDISWTRWYENEVQTKTTKTVTLRQAQRYMRLTDQSQTRPQVMGNKPVTAPEDTTLRRILPDRNDDWDEPTRFDPWLRDITALWEAGSPAQQSTFMLRIQ